MNLMDDTNAVCPHCGYDGSKKNPKGTLPLGTLIADRYLVGRYLRIDGEGATYLGFDNKEKIAILIKEYLPATLIIPRTDGVAVLPKPGSEVLFKTTMYDFIEIHQDIARYENISGIVHVNDIVNDNNTAYAIKEYVRSKTLVEYLNNVGYLDFNQSLNLLMPVFRAVELMHEQNILHRGVAPENILVEKNGKTRLNGFATQALRTKGSELKHSLYGGYSAPEQYDAVAFQDAFTDVYGLAAVLYTCVTGEVPPNAQERKSGDVLTFNKQSGAISPRQAKVLLQALSVNPNNRQQSVMEFLAQLQGKEVSSAQKSTPLAFLNNLTPKQKQIGMIGAGVALVLILFFAVLLSGLGKDKEDSDSFDETGSLYESGMSDSLQGEFDAVPNFVGMNYSHMVVNPQYKGKFTFVVEEVYSLAYKEGEIVEQTPAQGSTYTEGMTITLKVSKGEEKVEVPNIVGLDYSSAVSTLDSLGIKHSITYVYDTRYPAGYVSGMDKQVGYELSIEKETLVLYVVRVQETSEAPPVSSEAPPVSSEEPSSTEGG